MTTGQGNVPMSAEELRAFAEKVESWSQSLSGREQAFLGEILARAASTAGDDTRGYGVDYFAKFQPIGAQGKAGFLGLNNLSLSFAKIQGLP